MKCLVVTKKKKNVSFIFPVKGWGDNLFLSHFSIILLGSARLVGIILGANIVSP